MNKSYYSELYKLQDIVLKIVFNVTNGFYLSGGTALSRFHLGHRYSDDLDFFTGDVGLFPDSFRLVLDKVSNALPETSAEIDSRDFKRVIVESGPTALKLDFIADRLPRIGLPELRGFLRIDTVRNILGNKVCALMDRDEGRDMADVLCIARNRSFCWRDVLLEARGKQAFALEDMVFRIESFPLDMLDDVPFIEKRDRDIDSDDIKRLCEDIANERENSLAPHDASAL